MLDTSVGFEGQFDQAARALAELLPGRRRRRWLLELLQHPEIEDDSWTGTIQISVKHLGGIGGMHITRGEFRDFDSGTAQ